MAQQSIGLEGQMQNTREHNTLKPHYNEVVWRHVIARTVFNTEMNNKWRHGHIMMRYYELWGGVTGQSHMCSCRSCPSNSIRLLHCLL